MIEKTFFFRIGDVCLVLNGNCGCYILRNEYLEIESTSYYCCVLINMILVLRDGICASFEIESLRNFIVINCCTLYIFLYKDYRISCSNNEGHLIKLSSNFVFFLYGGGLYLVDILLLVVSIYIWGNSIAWIQYCKCKFVSFSPYFETVQSDNLLK